MKVIVKVISLPYILQVLYVVCFNSPRYQVSVYRTIGPLVTIYGRGGHLGHVTQSATNKLSFSQPKEAPHKIWL